MRKACLGIALCASVLSAGVYLVLGAVRSYQSDRSEPLPSTGSAMGGRERAPFDHHEAFRTDEPTPPLERGDMLAKAVGPERSEGRAENPADDAAAKILEEIEALERRISKHPDDADAHARRAWALQRLGRDRRALSSYDTALRLDPKNDAVRLRRVGAYVITGSPEKALEELDGMLERDPDDLDALSEKANVLGSMGRLDVAESIHREILARDEGNANSHFGLATTYAILGRWDDAEAHVTRSLELATEDYRAWVIAGRIALTRDAFEEADTRYAMAIDLRPGYPEALLGRAYALCRLRRFEEAIPLVEVALRFWPGDSEALALRGRIKGNTGDLDGAVQDLRAALARAPAGWEQRPQIEAWLAQREGRHHFDAVSELEMADRDIRLDPLNANAHHRRAWALHMEGEIDAALESYDEAIRLNPDDLEAMTNRAGALVWAGRAEEAIADADRVLARNPDDVVALATKGDAVLMTGRIDEAESIFLEVVDRDALNADAHAGLASIAHERGELEEAMRKIERALELDPESSYSWALSGYFASMAMDWEMAERHYGRSLELMPDDLESLMGRASALGQLWRAEEAFVLIERALEIAPDDPDALSIRGGLHVMHGDLDRAMRDYRRALELAGPDWDYRAELEDWMALNDPR